MYTTNSEDLVDVIVGGVNAVVFPTKFLFQIREKFIVG